MATHDHTPPPRAVASATTRRTLFGASAAALTLGTLPALAGPAAASASHPDAELIAVCAAFDRLEAHINSLYEGKANAIEDDDERDEAIEPLTERQEPLLDRMCAIRAKTPAGWQAKARSLAGWDLEILYESEHAVSWDDRMLVSLIRDMTGSAGA